jgi:hypothetical protein
MFDKLGFYYYSDIILKYVRMGDREIEEIGMIKDLLNSYLF